MPALGPRGNAELAHVLLRGRPAVTDGLGTLGHQIDLDQWLVLRGGLRMERFWIDWITDYLQAHERTEASA